jgi:hypothetical protein
MYVDVGGVKLLQWRIFLLENPLRYAPYEGYRVLKLAKKSKFMPTSAPIRLSVSEAAKFLGVSTRTIRRAVTADLVIYIVVNERYKITLDSLLSWAENTPTVQKKLRTVGFGAFVEKWKIPPPHKGRSPKSPA